MFNLYNPWNLSAAYFRQNSGPLLPKPDCLLSRIHAHSHTHLDVMLSESLVLFTVFFVLPFPLKLGIIALRAPSSEM